ncbi:putative zinc-binding oxidoreductase [Paramyrothecium foliicola]|nr:putative zinc-binding oxidoreductase [Paramyrothecium foliicola]
MKTAHFHYQKPSGFAHYSPADFSTKPLFPEPAQVPRTISGAEVVLRVEAVALNGNSSSFHLSGVVQASLGEGRDGTGNEQQQFRPGSEVYGTMNSTTGSASDDFVITETNGLALKPRNLTWAEAAAVAQSGLPAWQALFVEAGIPELDIDALAASGMPSMEPQQRRKLLLVTDASGDVGIYLVQLAALAGLHVVAVTESRTRDETFLRALGATEVIELGDLGDELRFFDYVINPSGGYDMLSQCWMLVANGGTLISLDPATSSFARDRPAAKEHVKASYFVPEPSSQHLSRLAQALELEFVRPFVAETISSEEMGSSLAERRRRGNRRGSIVSRIEH